MEYFIDGLTKYADFTGRASRKEYWMFVLFFFILLIGFLVLGALIGFPFVVLIYTLGLMIPCISIAVRRLHDTSRSGWWLLIKLIPLIGAIILIIFLVQDSHEENQYGPNPKQA